MPYVIADVKLKLVVSSQKSEQMPHLSVIVNVVRSAGVGGLQRHLCVEGDAGPRPEPEGVDPGGGLLQAAPLLVDPVVLARHALPREPGLELQPDHLLLLVLPDRVLLRHLPLAGLGSDRCRC